MIRNFLGKPIPYGLYQEAIINVNNIFSGQHQSLSSILYWDAVNREYRRLLKIHHKQNSPNIGEK